MMTVGIRDLKNRLSEYLRRVRSGESVLVTDRGEVVAELRPPGHGQPDPTVPAELLALAKRGVLALGETNEARLYPALPRLRRAPRRSAAQLLDDERGQR
jgi:antitoxin (DNA-binding transcriptional repressor) of toxin-antitoxin stability system